MRYLIRWIEWAGLKDGALFRAVRYSGNVGGALSPGADPALAATIHDGVHSNDRALLEDADLKALRAMQGLKRLMAYLSPTQAVLLLEAHAYRAHGRLWSGQVHGLQSRSC